MTGFSYGRFREHVGGAHPNRIWDYVGRVRVLLARWRQSRRALAIPLWRWPLSFLFFVVYSAVIGLAYEWAVRGKPRPFAVRPR